MRPGSAVGVGGALDILSVLYCIVLYEKAKAISKIADNHKS